MRWGREGRRLQRPKICMMDSCAVYERLLAEEEGWRGAGFLRWLMGSCLDGGRLLSQLLDLVEVDLEYPEVS